MPTFLSHSSTYLFQPYASEATNDKRANVRVQASFTECVSNSGASCIRGLRINAGGTVVQLTRRESSNAHITVTINAAPVDVSKSPYNDDDIYVAQITSLFIRVSGFGFKIWYDGEDRLYLEFSPFFENKVLLKFLSPCTWIKRFTNM